MRLKLVGCLGQPEFWKEWVYPVLDDSGQMSVHVAAAHVRKVLLHSDPLVDLMRGFAQAMHFLGMPLPLLLADVALRKVLASYTAPLQFLNWETVP